MDLPSNQSTSFRASAAHEDESIRVLLLEIGRSLVPRGGTVVVNISSVGHASTATVLTEPEHLGRLVGEQGRIARSIRTILTAAAMTFERRYTLDIKAIS